MVVILRYSVSAAASDLGRALHLRTGEHVDLEPQVSGETATVPFAWVHSERPSSLIESLRTHPSIGDVSTVETVGHATLLALKWETHDDPVFRGIAESEGSILRAVCRDGQWTFTVRFSDYDRLSALRRSYDDSGVALEVERVYHQSDLHAEESYGLTESQHEALTLAVGRGYYDIPRRYDTAELAEELGISAQAVTERLRRAVTNLTEHTILPAKEAESELRQP